MDCSICSSFPAILRPPRNTICVRCYEGITTAMALLLADSQTTKEGDDRKASNGSRSNSIGTNKGVSGLVEWIQRVKSAECEQNERLEFLASYGADIHTDVYVKAENGPPIATHRSILASRSPVFKNMLDADTCMASLKTDTTIPIPDLDFTQLQSLIHFLYTGTLPHDCMDRHVYSLALAAHKYDITYLQKQCYRFMLTTLTATTALDVLEVSDMCRNKELSESVMGFIVSNLEEIVFSEKYEAFASKRPHLSVVITRASVGEGRRKRESNDEH